MSRKEDPLVVTPLLDGEGQVRSASIDLRLGNDIVSFRRSRLQALDIAEHEGAAIQSPLYHDEVHLRYGQAFVLHPGEMVLGSALEYIGMPLDAAGEVKTRSTWGRLGLSILTSSQIAPGFKGALTLELLNVGGAPIVLYPCVRIAHLVVNEITPVKHVDQSAYMMNTGPSAAVLGDDELKALIVPKRQVIVGITGGMGSYAQVIADDLVKYYGFVAFSLSHLVRRETARRNLEPSGENLRSVGNSLREAFGDSVLVDRLLKRIRTEVASPFVVVEGIRNPGEIRALLSCRDSFVLGADADVEERHARVVGLRDWSEWGKEPTLEKFKSVDVSDMDDGLDYGVRIRPCLDKIRELSQGSGRGFYFDSNGMRVAEIHPKIREFVLHIERLTGLRIVTHASVAF